MTQASNLAKGGSNFNADGDLSLTTGVTGTLPVANGGTGVTTLASGRIPYGAGTSALASSSTFVFDGTNLGVGTTTPTAPLDITSSTAGYMNITGGSSSGQGSFIRFRKSATDVGYLGTSSAVLGDSTSDFLMYADGARNSVFWTNGQERMRIDSSGNVGIGTTSPTDTSGFGKCLDIRSSTGAAIYLRDSDDTTNDTFIIGRDNADSYLNSASGNILFFNAGAERMRIDNSGNVLIGKTASNTGTVGFQFILADNKIAVGASDGASALFNRNTSDGAVVQFARSGSVVGSVSVTASATAYNTSSDYRLKENILPMTGALATVAQLKPVTYKWKSTGENGQGFIAHELQALVPDCVSGEKDAVDENGNPEYQGIDTSFLVATLTAAIQELKAEFDAYKATHP
jgi:hypothetical protein